MIKCPLALSIAAKNHDRQSTRLAATNAAAVNARKAVAVDQSVAAAARRRAAAAAAARRANAARLNLGVSKTLLAVNTGSRSLVTLINAVIVWLFAL